MHRRTRGIDSTIFSTRRSPSFPVAMPPRPQRPPRPRPNRYSHPDGQPAGWKRTRNRETPAKPPTVAPAKPRDPRRLDRPADPPTKKAAGGGGKRARSQNGRKKTG